MSCYQLIIITIPISEKQKVSIIIGKALLIAMLKIIYDDYNFGKTYIE